MEKEKKLRIIKDDDYSPIYLNEDGKEVETNRSNLFDELRYLFIRMDTLNKMLDDDAYESYGFVAEVLIDDGFRRVDKMRELFKEIGQIKIDTPHHKDPFHSNPYPIGMLFTPAKKKVKALTKG